MIIDYRKLYIIVMPNQKTLKCLMFKLIMVFIRRKKVKGNTYYYIVESYKYKGKVKQRTLCYIGTADSLLRKLKVEH